MVGGLWKEGENVKEWDILYKNLKWEIYIFVKIYLMTLYFVFYVIHCADRFIVFVRNCAHKCSTYKHKSKLPI